MFVFLADALYAARELLGWKRACRLSGFTWAVAFFSEFLSTWIEIPFGGYVYAGSTEGQELYIFNIPFMDPLSFPFSSLLATVWRLSLGSHMRK